VSQGEDKTGIPKGRLRLHLLGLESDRKRGRRCVRKGGRALKGKKKKRCMRKSDEVDTTPHHSRRNRKRKGEEIIGNGGGKRGRLHLLRREVRPKVESRESRKKNSQGSRILERNRLRGTEKGNSLVIQETERT